MEWLYKALFKMVQDMDRRRQSPLGGLGDILQLKMFKLRSLETGSSTFCSHVNVLCVSLFLNLVGLTELPEGREQAY